MKHDDVALMVNTAFSIVELLARLQQTNPDLFAGQEGKIKALREGLAKLNDKPDDYLENWTGE